LPSHDRGWATSVKPVDVCVRAVRASMITVIMRLNTTYLKKECASRVQAYITHNTICSNTASERWTSSTCKLHSHYEEWSTCVIPHSYTCLVVRAVYVSAPHPWNCLPVNLYPIRSYWPAILPR